MTKFILNSCVWERPKDRELWIINCNRWTWLAGEGEGGGQERGDEGIASLKEEESLIREMLCKIPMMQQDEPCAGSARGKGVLIAGNLCMHFRRGNQIELIDSEIILHMFPLVVEGIRSKGCKQSKGSRE